MPKKHVIEFTEVESPVNELVTKFGGQPVWLSEPTWPLSRETGNQMRFIGQIALRKEYGFNTSAKMAYLFMTEEEDGQWVDGTYEPDGGENAVVLQPGAIPPAIVSEAEGPTLYTMVQVEGKDRLQAQPCEFATRCVEAEDVDFMPELERYKLSEEDAEAARGKLDENKVGGSPVFLQGDEFPFECECQLLLQLDSCSVPFYVNFGDNGVGYAFLNAEGDEGRFLWQCC